VNKLLGVGLALVLTAAAIGAETGPYQRWAIIGSPELAQTGWVDLLTVALAAQPDIQLVERSAVAEATRELALATVLEADGAGQRLKLGRLLGADALLLLSRELRDDERLLRIVVSDARIGARIWTECLTYEPGVPEPIVATLSERVAELRSRYPEGLSRIVGVPAFVSRNLVHDYDRLQDDLANVLAAGIGAFAGTAVIETEEAEAIAHELAISGTELAEHVVPLFIRGDYRVEEMGDERGALTLWLQVSGGSEPERTVERRYDGVASGVEALRGDLPTELLGATSAGPGLSIDEQVSLLTRQADSFARLWALRRAIGLREAALLLKPDSVELARQIIEDCIHIVPYEAYVRWDLIPPDEAISDWYARIGYWQRGLELLEQLIRRGALSQEVAYRLYRNSATSVDRFFLVMSDTYEPLSERPRYAPDLLAPLEPLGEECTRLHRRFLRDVLPLVRDLPQRETSPAFDITGNWARSCVSAPLHRSHNERSPASRAQLEQTREFILRYGAELSAELPLDMPLRASADPDYPREFSNAELLAFWEALMAEANAPAVQYQAESGLILFRATYRDDGQPRDVPALLAELEAWLARMPPDVPSKVQAIMCRRVDQWRSGLPLSRLNADVYRVPRMYPCQVTRPPVPLGLQPVHMMIARRDGTWEPLASLDWAGYAGWCQRRGMLCEFIPAGDFDVVWAPRGIFVQRQAGVLDEVHIRDDENVYQAVAFDGVNIWAVSCRTGVDVFALDGTLVARLSPADGMPPADRSACLEPLGPGDMLATGALGNPQRAWIARLWLNAGRVEVDVFHEATEVGPVDTNRDTIDVQGWSPRTAFVPDQIYRVPYPLSPGRVDLIVSRGSRRRFHLRVLLEERRVEVVPAFMKPYFGVDPAVLHFLEDGTSLLAHSSCLQLQKHSSLDAKGHSHRDLHRLDRGDFRGRIFDVDGLLYAPGRPWVRLDPTAGVTQELRPIQRCWLGASTSRFGQSALLGIVGYDEYGRLCRARFDEAAVTRLSPIVPTLPPEVAPPHPPEPTELLITAICCFRDARGLWPRTLTELQPQYFDGEVPSSIDYTWSPEGANRLTCRRGPQTWTYVFGGCDEGGYFFENQHPIPWQVPLPPAPDNTPEDTLVRIRSEYASRIEAEPGEPAHHCGLTSHLYEANRLSEARAAALEWIKAMPRDPTARRALLNIERAVRYGRDDWQDICPPDPEYTPETLVDWAVLHKGDLGNDAAHEEFMRVHGLPFARDAVEWYIAELVLFDICARLLGSDRPADLLAYCDAWERNAAQHPEATEASYVYFRAAALLLRGDVAGAREAAADLPDLVAAGRLWAQDVPDLLKALVAGDTSFPRARRFRGTGGEDWPIEAEGTIDPTVVRVDDATPVDDVDDVTANWGTVLSPTGQRLADATVLMLTAEGQHPAEPKTFYIGPSRDPSRRGHVEVGERTVLAQAKPTHIVVTDAQGRFRLPDTQLPLLVAALHPAGYAQTVVDRIAPDFVLTLEPWGRIEGHCLLGGVLSCELRLEAAEWPDSPIPGVTQHAWAFNAVFAQTERHSRFHEADVQAKVLMNSTGVDGVFVFERVAPGRWRLEANWPHGENAPQYDQELTVEPGGVTRVELVPCGRLVTGHVVTSAGPIPASLGLHVRVELVPVDRTPEQTRGYRIFGRHAGVFRFHDVTPGEYRLRAWTEARRPNEQFESEERTVHIPPADDLAHAPPVYVGEVVMTEKTPSLLAPRPAQNRRSCPAP
jgi:hypothetical protein